MSRASRRAFPLFFGAFGAVVSLVVAGAVPATSASAAVTNTVTTVAVIPQDAATTAVDDEIVMAGTTGFLHRYNFGSQYLWTDYATGRTVSVPALAGIRPASMAGRSRRLTWPA